MCFRAAKQMNRRRFGEYANVAEPATSPLEQFAIHRIVDIHIGGIDVSLTNSGRVHDRGDRAASPCS